jgi:large repetitive protein
MTSLCNFFLFLTLFFVSKPAIAYDMYSAGDQSPWPMAFHDKRHTGLSTYNTTDTPFIVKWKLEIGGGAVNSGIAIGNDGTLYFGSGDFYFNAAFPNGTLKWRYHGDEDYFCSTPAIADDGTIYVGSWDYYFYAFFPNGTLKWKRNCGSSISYASPIIGDDGTIYTATINPGNKIIAINPDGTEKWHYTTGDFIQSAPVISLDGSIIFGSGDSYVYCLRPNGTVRWQYKTGDEVVGTPSIAEDGTVYIFSWDGYLYALNPLNGTMIWRCQVWGGNSANPSIGPDGTIYVAGTHLYAINPNGTRRWTFILDDYNQVRWSSPAISADGIIYFGTCRGNDAGGEFYAVNSDGTERWRFSIGNRGFIDSSPAIDSDGTIYFGSSPGMSFSLWAIGRGPLLVDVKSPSTGYYNTLINFSGNAYGGNPPYSYYWDFGDGSSSNQQNPSHTYKTIGQYTTTFTVTDSESNQSSDTTTITIMPVITKPTNGLFILGARIFSLTDRCIIIGPITVEAQASQDPLKIDRVEFYLDGKLKATDMTAPYTWRWGFGLLTHTIQVTAYDSQEHSASATIDVFKLF